MVDLLGGPERPGAIRWADLGADGPQGPQGPQNPQGEPEFEEVPFDHPLWVVYSSGTTGLPKPIMHGHGGIVLEHLKALSLHQDLRPGDVFSWYTTTGWMMWNYLAGALLAGATIVLYDGSATYPGTDRLWRLAAEHDVSYLGVGAPYLVACMKAGLHPGEQFDLSALRGLGSTGSPLPPEAFDWVYSRVKSDVLLGSFSGGTDLCTGFVGPCPLLPVRAGVISGRCLGALVEAYDEDGKPVTGEVGELVITKPMPSMPVGFWNDPGGARYRESYFERFAGVWRHGDWIRVLPDGGCVIYGRSDATLNRGGVRMGTSEFYRVVEAFPEVADSLVVDTGALGAEGRLILYVVLADGTELDDDLTARLRAALRAELSPRHVPDEIHPVPGIPRTLSGKKLEVPVRKIMLGTDPERAADLNALANPDALRYFGRFRPRLPEETTLSQRGGRLSRGPSQADKVHQWTRRSGRECRTVARTRPGRHFSPRRFPHGREAPSRTGLCARHWGTPARTSPASCAPTTTGWPPRTLPRPSGWRRSRAATPGSACAGRRAGPWSRSASQATRIWTR
jgi:acetoacetyl-CoA synthetase